MLFLLNFLNQPLQLVFYNLINLVILSIQFRWIICINLGFRTSIPHPLKIYILEYCPFFVSFEDIMIQKCSTIL